MTKILLVEDNETNRTALARRPVRRGHEVSLAGDGSDAIARARADAKPVDLQRLIEAMEGLLAPGSGT